MSAAAAPRRKPAERSRSSARAMAGRAARSEAAPIKPLYRPAKHSRWGPPREVVRRDQLMRLRDATIEAMLVDGYEATSVVKISTLAAVSRQTFYERFPRGKQQCFLATYDFIVGQAAEQVTDAWERESDWQDGLRAAFTALAELVVAHPKAARLALVETLGAGPAGFQRMDRARALFERMVGPRHLQGGVRFHALTQIDVASHHAGIEIISDRSDQRVLQAFYGFWERHGLPVRLQLDNGGPFVSPTGLGEVVRVFLHQTITPVFIPPREPWRNGTVEHFNDTFDKRFFRTERFSGLEYLIERAGAFERFHNAQHRYSATGGRTPQESTGQQPRRRPLPAEEIPAGWPAQGRVEFIRFIRSDLRLRILGRSIPMPNGTAYQYVTATLDLSIHNDENLLVSDVDGQLLTRARLRTPRR